MTPIRFGGFLLDMTRRELSHGGSPVTLGSRAFEILCVLARANGETVSKNQLMAQVWPNRIVEDSNIHVHVSALRKALETKDSNLTCLVTVPGQGYRLVGIEANAAHNRSEAQPLSWKLSIAVLPFRSITDGSECAALAEGLTSDIITELSRIRSLSVIARTAVVSRGDQADDVGREIDPSYVLGGSVRCLGTGLRVTAQLLEADSKRHLWAEKFDCDLIDSFKVHDEITRSIVSAIQHRIYLNESHVADQHDPPTLRIWRRGFRELSDFTPESLRRARLAGHKVVRAAPDSALGYRLIGSAALQLVMLCISTDRENLVEEACRAADRAVILAPRDEYAQTLIGLVYGTILGRYEAAFAAFRCALEINPTLSLAYGAYSVALSFAGLADEAITNTQIAQRLNPRDPGAFLRCYSVLSLAYFVKGDLNLASQWAERAVTAKPDWWFGWALQAATQALLSKPERAAQSAGRLRDLLPGISTSNLPGVSIKGEIMNGLKQALLAAGLPEEWPGP